MRDEEKNTNEVLEELSELRQHNVALLEAEKGREQAEEALRESRRTLSTLLDNLPGMAYRCRNDKDWTMEFVSNGSFALTGYHPSELIDNLKISYAELIHPEDREMVWDDVQRALSKREPFRLVYRIFRASGEERWVWEQGIGVFEDDTLVALEGFITDINERVHAEKALRESEQNYRTLVESSSDAILVLDKERRIVSCNRAFLKLFGLDPEKDLLKGRSIKFVHPSEESFLSFGEKAYPKINQEGSFRTEWELMRKEGTLFPVEGVFSSIRDDDGAIQGYVAVIRDITERKRTEEELRRARDHLEELVQERTADLLESEEKHRTLVENVPLVIYRMDPHGKILLINQFVEKVFGHSPSEVFRHPELLNERLHQEDREKVAAFRKECLEEGKESLAEYRILHKKGHTVHVMDHAIPLHREDGSVSVVDGIIMDVSERVEMEERLLRARELETVSDISARLAHEIRNPLVSVGGFARRLLLSMSLDDPNRKKGEIIVNEVGRLEKILKMVLSYIQPLDLYLTPTNPNRLVESALSKVSKEMEEINVRADLELASELPAICMDPVQMERVLATLMRTALSQTSKGSVLSIRTLMNEAHFELVMTYPALHLSPDDLKHFFYPFTSSPLDHDVAYLPLSKMMVGKYGGNINVKMEEPGFVSIRISLPISGTSSLSPKSEGEGACDDLGSLDR